MRASTPLLFPARLRGGRVAAALVCVTLSQGTFSSPAANPAAIDWVPIAASANVPGFDIARTETTVGQFRRFVQATGTVTRAERAGGGQVYEAGWATKPGWTWVRPFGVPAADAEPAVHVDFTEAQAFCRWAGGQLPADAQWLRAAYTETRAAPPAPFQPGKTYPYPTGDSPQGAQCLGDCGSASDARAVRHGANLWRGRGHAAVTATPAGVNGLHDMGANAWEWVDEPPGATGSEERRTRGGSWWYGAAPMRADHLQGKPPATTVVYIGFRCARSR
jgi:formylglycine-generating enzyme required for sulfatase activity